MNMKKSSNMVRKIVPVFLAIMLFMTISANMAAAYESEEGQETVSEGSEWVYYIDLSDEGGMLTYTIDEIQGGSVDVMLMDSGNYAAYILGNDYDTIEEDDEVYWSVSNTLSLDADVYVLVVESSDGSDVSFHYSVKYGADYNPSFWDFMADSGLTLVLCGSSLIFLIIWLLVVIWVYKDANKRGKSGLAWAILVLLFPLIGLIIWLIVRPPEQPVYPAQNYVSPAQYPPQGYQQPPQYPAQHGGTPPMVKRCPNCGAEVQPGAAFCPNCGAKL